MSEKKVGKRLLTWVLVLVMTLSLLPLNVLADEAGETESQMEQTVNNGDFSMTKRATPNEDGSYNITLSVTPLKPPATKPLELVILLDLSGSMVYCPMEAGKGGKVDDPSYSDHEHYNSLIYGIGCTAVENGMATSRIDTARNAINNMVSELQKKGVAFNLSVVKFADVYDAAAVIQQQPIANQDDVNFVASTLSSLTPNGGTYMVPGLNVAASQFTSDSTTEKVFLMLADGDFDDSTWFGIIPIPNKDGILNAAKKIKDNGATAYTIGFAADVDILKDIASDPSKYSTAGDATTLNSIFAQITEEIKGVYVTDTMGANVSLRPGTAFAAAVSGTATETNGGITWNLAKPQQDETQTLTYTVTPNLRVGRNQYNLNGETMLHCGETTLSVPAPYVTLSAYQVTTKRYVNGELKDTVTGPVQLLPEGGYDLSWSSDPYNNAPLVEAKLNSEVQEGNSALLTEAKAYTLDLYYANEYTVEYKWADAPAGVTLPTDTETYLGVAAAKAAVDKKYTNGYQFSGSDGYFYTFSGWNEGTVNGQVVTFNGSWTKGDKDNSQWYTVKYTWADAPEGVTLPTDTETYLGVAAAKAAVDKKYTNGYQFSGSDGYFYTFSGWNEGTVDGQVVTFTGSWTMGDKDPSKWYTLAYSWTGADKLSETLPSNPNSFFTPDEAKAAVDTTFTSGKKVTGSDGYFYTFSGWGEGTVNGQVVTFTGSWTMGDKDPSKWYTLAYSWTGADKLSETLPSNPNSFFTPDEAKAAVDTTFTSGKKVTGSDGYFYTFSGWGEGTVNGQVVTFTGSWTQGDKDPSKWYTLAYSWTGADKLSETLPSNPNSFFTPDEAKAAVDTTFTSGKKVTGSDGYFYTFSGWGEGTVNGQVVTFTASWTKGEKDPSKWATVTFNSNGGSTVASQTVKYNDKAKEPTAPTKSGYTFAGWYTEEQLTTKYVFDTPVTGNITLYAKWNTNYVPYYPPVPPTVKIEDDDALGLNTTDHFAYIVGYGNGEVRPQNNITRAEVATIFFRLLTDDVRDENLTKTNRYSDVAATSWYNTAVSTLSSMGIITGYPDGTFRPNAAITRAEFAAIAARFDNDGDKTAAKFSDIATHWAKDEISIAYNNGWITGYPDGTFGPQRDITRAETMTLVNRVLNRQPETEEDLLPNMTVWTDNANPKAWYYLAVQEATNSHYYEFKTNSQYEKWTELRETRDWTQLEK